MKKRTKNDYLKYHWKKLSLELVVVFLGITLGFILNNYRMTLQDKKLEKNYLMGFLQDIELNNIMLKQTLESDSLWIKKLNPLLGLFKDGSICIDSANIAIIHSLGFQTPRLSSVTYQNIINSGSLNLIRNFQIKEKIVSYHSSIDNLKYINESIFSYYLNSFIPFFLEEFCFFNFTLLDPEAINNRKLANYLNAYHNVRHDRMVSIQNLLNESHELKNELIGIGL